MDHLSQAAMHMRESFLGEQSAANDVLERCIHTSIRIPTAKASGRFRK